MTSRFHRPFCLLVLVAALSQTSHACHVAASLRHYEDLTARQQSLLIHGAMSHEQIPYTLERATACTGGMADIFPCDKVDLLSVRSLSQLGGGSGNDMWGWVDPLTGTEWALFGRTTGTSFVNISDPENPTWIGNLPTEADSSTWRDIKVYKNHALVVADRAGAHGMQIFDLTRLRSVASTPETFDADFVYNGFDRAHNIVVDETSGFAYAVGSETCNGGLHMIDVRDLTSPTFVGCFSADGYTHDAQCVTYAGPDTEHRGKQLCFAANEDTVTVVDVTDKGNPIQLSRSGYAGNGYTHQGWLTEDHAYFVLDDELDEIQQGHNTRTYLWDLADLDAPTILDTFEAAGAAIDHNQYVHDGYAFQANYRRGMRILRVAPPEPVAEVAFFDTYPAGDEASFSGAWSVYPFFPSGVVAISDINRGLFLVRPQLEPPSAVFGDGFESGDVGAWSHTNEP